MMKNEMKSGSTQLVKKWDIFTNIFGRNSGYMKQRTSLGLLFDQTYKLNLEVDIFCSQDPSLLGKDLADTA